MGILQARVLEWVAIPSSRGSSQPSDLTQVSHITGRFFTEPLGKLIDLLSFWTGRSGSEFYRCPCPLGMCTSILLYVFNLCVIVIIRILLVLMFS